MSKRVKQYKMVMRLTVGIFVGEEVGALVRLDVGATVGLDDGTSVGLDIGASVGLDVGTLVGLNIGTLVGLAVGSFDGKLVEGFLKRGKENRKVSLCCQKYNHVVQDDPLSSTYSSNCTTCRIFCNQLRIGIGRKALLRSGPIITTSYYLRNGSINPIIKVNLVIVAITHHRISR